MSCVSGSHCSQTLVSGSTGCLLCCCQQICVKSPNRIPGELTAGTDLPVCTCAKISPWKIYIYIYIAGWIVNTLITCIQASFILPGLDITFVRVGSLFRQLNRYYGLQCMNVVHCIACFFPRAQSVSVSSPKLSSLRWRQVDFLSFTDYPRALFHLFYFLLLLDCLFLFSSCTEIQAATFNLFGQEICICITLHLSVSLVKLKPVVAIFCFCSHSLLFWPYFSEI